MAAETANTTAVMRVETFGIDVGGAFLEVSF